MSNYPIIVFEGVEGSGKSLHIKNLEKYLKKKNISYQKLREPGGTKNSEKIRNLILNKKSNFDIKSDLFLYLAARNENYKSIIQKNYKKKVILIDRFTDSTLAYQHYGMGLNKQIIILINKFILNKINPSFTFLNIVNMKNLKLRLKRRLNKNRYDNFNVKFYNRVQNGYIKLSRNKKKYLIIDSNKNINENKNIIINKINSILSL